MIAQSEKTTAWLDLSDAADYLGVHFTTLRRWTDDGKVPCIRTPGGRRRYRLAELTAFLASLQRGELRVPGETALVPTPPRHVGLAGEPWIARLSEAQRTAMRQGGQQLMAVLMQYASRREGGEAFLREGRRLAALYGVTNQQAGLSLLETLRAFLLVRRSINDAVYQAGSVAGAPDEETWRLYERVAFFLDVMLEATVEAFEQAQPSRLPCP